MHVLITYKNEDQIKNESARVAPTFLPLLVFGNYSRHNSRAANSTVPSESWAKFKPIQAFMTVLITCKIEKVPIKNESTIVVTTLNINVQTIKGR